MLIGLLKDHAMSQTKAKRVIKKKNCLMLWTKNPPGTDRGSRAGQGQDLDQAVRARRAEKADQDPARRIRNTVSQEMDTIALAKDPGRVAGISKNTETRIESKTSKNTANLRSSSAASEPFPRKKSRGISTETHRTCEVGMLDTKKGTILRERRRRKS